MKAKTYPELLNDFLPKSKQSCACSYRSKKLHVPRPDMEELSGDQQWKDLETMVHSLTTAQTHLLSGQSESLLHDQSALEPAQQT
jgi:hypothetical protein